MVDLRRFLFEEEGHGHAFIIEEDFEISSSCVGLMARLMRWAMANFCWMEIRDRQLEYEERFAQGSIRS